MSYTFLRGFPFGATVAVVIVTNNVYTQALADVICHVGHRVCLQSTQYMSAVNTAYRFRAPEYCSDGLPTTKATTTLVFPEPQDIVSDACEKIFLDRAMSWTFAERA